MGDKNKLSRREFIRTANYGMAGLGLASLTLGACGQAET